MYQGAVEDYRQAMALRPDFAEAISNRGAALEALDDLQGALGDYQQALAIAPKFAAAHYNAALLHAKTGDLDKCLVHLEQAVDLEPGLRSEAARDDNLGWVLKMRTLKEDREKPGRRG